ncbi:MAG: UDP-N-acetylmuramate dehydrogenase [Syntrophomonadaceae bacterium]|jgi:UDP-N-acetylmuramate dehydrogenase|nr:UDP-N-acetylmuramate dehydrogenase [Syntrophomonadaceae bacterium]
MNAGAGEKTAGQGRYAGLGDLLPGHRLHWQEPMSRHTTFGIGGPADVLVVPESIPEVRTVLAWCRREDVPWVVIGAGSNLLVRDKGIRGVVIKLGAGLGRVEIRGESVWAQAGVPLAHLVRVTAAAGLSGLEFAEGIPGSLGGGLCMNAGAYGGEMAQVTQAVLSIDPDGRLCLLMAEEIGFGYRSSCFQENGHVVLAGHLRLRRGDARAIAARIADLAARRGEKQPLDMPSAGSAFKRPPGGFVGPLVEQLGFKGYRIGGAQVSSKHAGFIVNAGGATAADVIRLLEAIRAAARERLGIALEPEIRVLGEE